MKKITYAIIGALISSSLLFLSGCVPHLSKQQCETINWSQMGYSDGQQGRNPRNLQNDITDCAKFKLTVNTKAYQRGYTSGVRAFCKPSNGYKWGVNGKNYNHICPSNMAGAFDRSWRRGLRKYCTPSTGYNLGRNGRPMPNFCAADLINPFRNAYQSGFRVYRAIAGTQDELNRANGQINDANDQIADLQNDINHQQHAIDHGNRHQRGRAYAAMRSDRRQIHDLQRQLRGLRYHRDFLQAQLNREKLHR